LYKGRIVSSEGFKSRATAGVATGKLSQWKGSPQATVVEIVTVKASKNLKLQHISTSGLQQVPYQSLTNHQFPQGSIGFGIWFGIIGAIYLVHIYLPYNQQVAFFKLWNLIDP